MKKTRYFFSIILCLALALSFAACGKADDEIDQTEIYNEINSLVSGYTPEFVSYEVELTSNELGLTLNNKGLLKQEEENYTYTYSYQYLNKIGSGAESLISTEEGTITGTKDSVLSQGFELTDGTIVNALDLAGCFKTHNVIKDGENYVMSGYIARNTIIKKTENLDEDIRFYYEITVNSDVTEIEKLVITYVTKRFDSVTITIYFKEA